MTTAPSNLRMGIVPYVNVLPLLEGLGDHFPESRWIRATPRELATMIAAGQIDVATLPTFEVLRDSSLRIVPGCAIACDGPVRSVQLFGTRAVVDMQRVLLDRSSLTSVHLARVLLAESRREQPEFVLSDKPVTTETNLESLGVDGAVVIGDTALQWSWARRWPVEWDLGQGWKDLTGLPFVFAVWAARADCAMTSADERAFAEARKRGRQNVHAIAERALVHHPGATLEQMVEYLSVNIRYDLGPREQEAIATWRTLLVKHGFLKA